MHALVYPLVSLARGVAHRLVINRYPSTFRPFYRWATKAIIRPYVNMLGVPIIAITGTNGKTTTTRLIERIFRDAGYNVGACTTEAVTHNGAVIWAGDGSWSYGAWRAAQCPNLDLLVLETARGGLIKYGPGFRQCNVGVVTNVYEDHLGFDGINTLEEMAEVKSLIPRHTYSKGFIVLNGDDDLVRRMVQKTWAAPIYFVTEKSPDQFERVFFTRGNFIYKRITGREEAVIDVRELSVTYGGLLNFNIPNVMAALAAVEGIKKLLPLDDDSVKKTLQEFGSEPLDNIKRFSVVTYKGEWVVLGYSKNPESFRRDIEVIKTIEDRGGFRYVVGVLSAIGNREEKYYREISELVAPVCDYFFVRPPIYKYLRGRSGEEIVGLLSGAIPQGKILSTPQGSIAEIIAYSRERLAGKILFVAFASAWTDTIDLWEIFKEAEFQSPHDIKELLGT